MTPDWKCVKIFAKGKRKDDRYTFVQGKSRVETDLSMIRNEVIFNLFYFGSALKFCLIAEGKADLHVKLGHTAIWDTVAGQHILENAGGSVVNFQGQVLNVKADRIKNESFVAHGNFKMDLKKIFKT